MQCRTFWVKVYDKCQEARNTPKQAAERIAEAKGFAGEIQNTEMLTKAENAIMETDSTSEGKQIMAMGRYRVVSTTCVT